MSKNNEISKSVSEFQSSRPGSDQYNRNANVERLRLFAAFGIVVFHVLPTETLSKSIGYAGLPIFLMVFSALILSHEHEIAVKPFLFNKASRLLAPWVFWSLVYFVAKGIKLLIIGDTALNLSGNLLLVGPSVHLWYLPYAFAMALVLFLYQKKTAGQENGIGCIVATIAAMVCYSLCAVLMAKTHLRVPLPQWLFGLPGVLLGITIAHMTRLGKMRYKFTVFFVIWGLLVLISYLLVQREIHPLSLPYLVAFPLATLCFFWPGRIDRLTLKISTLTYGIYLVHPLVISVLSRIVPTSPLFPLGVFVVSGVITAFIKKTRLSWTV